MHATQKGWTQVHEALRHRISNLFCIAFVKKPRLPLCSSALPCLLQQTRCDIDTRDANGR